MTDPRIKQLAKNLIGYSLCVKPGDNVLIEETGGCDELVRELFKEIYRVGAVPFLWERTVQFRRELLMNCNEDQLELMAKADKELMNHMQCYIGVRSTDNNVELCDVPAEKMDMFMQHYSLHVHHEIRVPKTRWVVLRYPSPANAQAAGMSTEAFEDFYFDVCNLDYSKMDVAMDALVALMKKTDKVRIVGKDTDLTFSIKDIPVIKCSGQFNIPDGEVFTAPVRESVNGVLHYNAPSLENGFVFEDVRLVFKDGKIIEATANDTERVNRLFDTDEGARYVGEFAIGVHPYILKPMMEILYDEKICGSFHFTPGNAYAEAFNGNKSALHWDLVCIQTKEYGGGEIWFDDVLVRKDGLFVTRELECLNPENLK